VNIRIVVADDHPVLLAGVEHLLRSGDGFTVAGLVKDSTALVRHLSTEGADVAVSDFSMPAGQYGDGIALLRFLKRRFPQLRLVLLTGMENPAVLASVMAVGVNCIVSKADPMDHLLPAIRAAWSGQGYQSPEILRLLAELPVAAEAGVGASALSKRELEVLRMFAQGLSVMEIANRVGRSRKTISTQKVAAMRKLALQTDADVFAYAIAEGLVQASQVTRAGVG